MALNKHRFENYISVRTGNYPFPVNSILAFWLSLELSNELTQEGDLLEIGVEHGGTALLLAQYPRDRERLNLIDLKRSDRFSESLDKLPAKAREKVVFWECSSRSEELSQLLSERYRYVHIDGGHARQDVLDDAHRFAHLLSSNGICVFDDFFEVRWPGVTEAVLEYLADGPLAAFMVADRKIYCTRKEDHASMLAAAKTKISALAGYGSLRTWIEPLCRSDMMVVKINANAETHSLLR